MKNERIKRLSFGFRADILFHLIGVACVTRIIRRHEANEANNRDVVQLRS